jgi:hypothetical protein
MSRVICNTLILFLFSKMTWFLYFESIIIRFWSYNVTFFFLISFLIFCLIFFFWQTHFYKIREMLGVPNFLPKDEYKKWCRTYSLKKIKIINKKKCYKYQLICFTLSGKKYELESSTIIYPNLREFKHVIVRDYLRNLPDQTKIRLLNNHLSDQVSFISSIS